jgi:signal transduction histidine kinase
MFKRTRRRIIISIMGSLSLLFIITLSVILLASYREMQRNNLEKLEKYADMYLPESQRNYQNAPARKDNPPDLPPDKQKQNSPSETDSPDFQLSVFYSVAFSKNKEVIDVRTGEKELYEEEELVSLAKEALGESSRNGRIGNLLYLVSSRPGYTLVAFLDNTMENSSMKLMIRNFIIVGLAAMLVLFVISAFIAGRIVRPLEESDRKQKQFISDASHELKTPVSVINANTEILGREIGENEWLSNIRYESERMGMLLKQLLDLSRAESASVPIEKMDLSSTVAGDTLALESLAYDQGRIINADIDENIHITGNRTQMEQLVSVLLDNAIRHSSGKEIRISLKKHGRSAVMSVSNESSEIPEEKLKFIFDRFYRVDEVRNSEDNHYGLGLSIAKAVVLNHKGNISVSCKDGKVTFTVTLPVS